MKEKKFNSWVVTRSKGKIKYFITHGVLSYGLIMFVIMAFIERPFVDGLTSQTAIIHYITWPLAGLFFGVSTWYIAEYMYKKELSKRST